MCDAENLQRLSPRHSRDHHRLFIDMRELYSAAVKNDMDTERSIDSSDDRIATPTSLYEPADCTAEADVLGWSLHLPFRKRECCFCIGRDVLAVRLYECSVAPQHGRKRRCSLTRLTHRPETTLWAETALQLQPLHRWSCKPSLFGFRWISNTSINVIGRKGMPFSHFHGSKLSSTPDCYNDRKRQMTTNGDQT